MKKLILNDPAITSWFLVFGEKYGLYLVLKLNNFFSVYFKLQKVVPVAMDRITGPIVKRKTWKLSGYAT